MENNVVEYINNQLVIDKETLKQMKKDYVAYLRLKRNEDLIKELARPLMEQYGINRIDNNLFKVDIKPSHTRKIADTDKMKACGIYEEYTKEVEVKPSVSISWK